MEKANRGEIKVKAEVQFTPKHATKARRGSRGMALLFLLFLQRHARTALPSGKTRYPFLQEIGWAPRPG